MRRALLFLILGLCAAPFALAQSQAPFQPSCAAALARIAPQACAGADFAQLWDTLSSFETPAQAPGRTRFERSLRVCRGLPGSDPMPCLERRVWLRLATLARAADPATNVGRYLGAAGQAVEIWPTDSAGNTPVTIRQPQKQAPRCAVTLNTWRLRGELTFVGELTPGETASYCDFRLRRIGTDVILAGQTQCRAACAPDADHAGRYRLGR